VPAEVDLRERGSVRHAFAAAGARRCDAAGQQEQRFPRRLRARHTRAGRRLAEDVRVVSEKCAPAEELLESAACLERDDARHFGLRVLLEDSDPAVSPVDLRVVDLQHLAAPAAGVERTDDDVCVKAAMSARPRMCQSSVDLSAKICVSDHERQEVLAVGCVGTPSVIGFRVTSE